jgi:hypothetical protein
MTNRFINYLPQHATRQRRGIVPWLTMAGISF